MKKYLRMLSAAVVTGALRVKSGFQFGRATLSREVIESHKNVPLCLIKIDGKLWHPAYSP